MYKHENMNILTGTNNYKNKKELDFQLLAHYKLSLRYITKVARAINVYITQVQSNKTFKQLKNKSRSTGYHVCRFALFTSRSVHFYPQVLRN